MCEGVYVRAEVAGEKSPYMGDTHLSQHIQQTQQRNIPCSKSHSQVAEPEF
jgi:hypothetical protein